MGGEAICGPPRTGAGSVPRVSELIRSNISASLSPDAGVETVDARGASAPDARGDVSRFDKQGDGSGAGGATLSAEGAGG